ncbi:MAG: hypothetical protein F4X61_12040 [Rhodothermaceae bacterium]|nr:hypothetical protein [Rhodothermaceae bacterium]
MEALLRPGASLSKQAWPRARLSSMTNLASGAVSVRPDRHKRTPMREDDNWLVRGGLACLATIRAGLEQV